MKQIVGTSYFLAPEIAKECGYNERCDLWSMGVILYMILCGEAPFFGNRNGNGTIDVIEFGNAYKEFVDKSMAVMDDDESREEDIQRLFRALDADNTGTISYSDFVVGALSSLVEIDNITLRKVFEALDTDNAGTITREKIKAFITEDGPYSKEQVDDIVENANVLDNGYIEFEKFRELMQMGSLNIISTGEE